MFKFQKLPQMRVVVPLRLGSQYISVVFDVIVHVFRSFFSHQSDWWNFTFCSFRSFFQVASWLPSMRFLGPGDVRVNHHRSGRAEEERSISRQHQEGWCAPGRSSGLFELVWRCLEYEPRDLHVTPASCWCRENQLFLTSYRAKLRRTLFCRICVYNYIYI